jgi:hypothetical protein
VPRLAEALQPRADGLAADVAQERLKAKAPPRADRDASAAVVLPRGRSRILALVDRGLPALRIPLLPHQI